jgi:ADP-ribose pyrophosphatase YjhB (NUDIX family)
MEIINKVKMNPKNNFQCEPFLNPLVRYNEAENRGVTPSLCAFGGWVREPFEPFALFTSQRLDLSFGANTPTRLRVGYAQIVRRGAARSDGGGTQDPHPTSGQGRDPSFRVGSSEGGFPARWRFRAHCEEREFAWTRSIQVKLGNLKRSPFECERSIVGINEIRYISKIRVDSAILKTIFDYVCPRISFNLMMITNDHKIFLLQRSQSFHYPKVIRDLKLNKINLNLLKSLYTSEMETVRHLFFDFLPPPKQEEHLKEDVVYIFPGGHSNRGEPVLLTLLREFQEETSLKVDIQNLKFHQSCIFNVLIYDLLIQKQFNNYVFPVKIDLSSKEISDRFVPTKHTKNPTFVDISGCETLSDIFVRVQNFMLL